MKIINISYTDKRRNDNYAISRLSALVEINNYTVTNS